MLELEYSQVDRDCGKSVLEIMDDGINIWVKVLLNNYSKIKTNNCVEEKAHKTSKKVQKHQGKRQCLCNCCHATSVE